MSIAIIVALSLFALAAALGLGFLLGRHSAQTRSARPGGKIRATDRDIVL